MIQVSAAGYNCSASTIETMTYPSMIITPTTYARFKARARMNPTISMDQMTISNSDNDVSAEMPALADRTAPLNRIGKAMQPKKVSTPSAAVAVCRNRLRRRASVSTPAIKPR